MTSTRHQKRIRIIQYIYTFELFNNPVDGIEAFESGEYSDGEIRMIEAISKNYCSLRRLIESKLSDKWTWERVAPLTRSILIYGAIELTKSDDALIINEMVQIAKEFTLEKDATYKFVNGVMQEVAKHYANLKKS